MSAKGLEIWKTSAVLKHPKHLRKKLFYINSKSHIFHRHVLLHMSKKTIKNMSCMCKYMCANREDSVLFAHLQSVSETSAILLWRKFKCSLSKRSPPITNNYSFTSLVTFVFYYSSGFWLHKRFCQTSLKAALQFTLKTHLRNTHSLQIHMWLRVLKITHILLEIVYKYLLYGLNHRSVRNISDSLWWKTATQRLVYFRHFLNRFLSFQWTGWSSSSNRTES